MAILNRNQPLEERITAIREELDKAIDDRVAADCKGLPRRSPWCDP